MPTAFEYYKQEHKDAKKNEFNTLDEDERKPYEQKAARDEIEDMWGKLGKKQRRLNGWTLFVQKKNTELADSGMSFTDRNAIVCKQWGALGAEGKDEYNQEAEKLNIQRGFEPVKKKEPKKEKATTPTKKEKKEDEEEKKPKKESKEKKEKKDSKRKSDDEESKKKKPSLKKKKVDE